MADPLRSRKRVYGLRRASDGSAFEKWESFRKTHNFNYLEEDRKGFETWKNMTPEERSPFVLLSKMVDLKYDEVLLKEVDELEFQADDEADSLGFENFDLKDHGFSNGWDSINSEGFDSSEWSQE
ncbi:uncharacterized protein LOC122081302 isoform X6 [Macadamia integrifolia]|uniref:uncharacterized protein LOC122081302 isoform X6 n=1 Tax=Macadamia integrifolia TaxID=60698 RepID=UPI001C4F647A|nr:uncharacterized protein LOC122081302 isoform X6 [Macadamia integrifolia]